MREVRTNHQLHFMFLPLELNGTQLLSAVSGMNMDLMYTLIRLPAFTFVTISPLVRAAACSALGVLESTRVISECTLFEC